MVSAHLPPDMDVATEGDSGCEIPVNPSVQFSSIGEPLETLTASLNVSVRVDVSVLLLCCSWIDNLYACSYSFPLCAVRLDS